MSLRWPVDNVTVTQEFGGNPDYYKQFGQIGHNGIDIGVPLNTPVYAADDGTIVYEGWGQNNSWAGTPAGIWILLDNTGLYTGYAHLNKTVVNKGDVVKKGQLIGYSGQTGAATGPHVHFETIAKNPNFNNGYAGRINPTAYIGDNMATITDEEYQDLLRWKQIGIGLQDERDNSTYPQINALRQERDTVLYPFVQAVTADLGLPNVVDTPGAVGAIDKLKSNQGGVDQATKDTITQTNSNVNWLVQTFKDIFNIK